LGQVNPSAGPEILPFLVGYWKLVSENELQPALAPDRNHIPVKGMVSNPDLRSAPVAPKTDGVIPSKLAEFLGQTIPKFLFCWHALSSVLE
jgi:hypothetical protein